MSDRSWYACVGVTLTWLIGGVICSASPVHAQSPGTSRWGANDQRGAANLLTSAKVLEAVGLIRTGDVYMLGRPFEAGMPFFSNRSYRIRTYGQGSAPVGKNLLTVHAEFIESELGQVGTQFDGLGHMGVGDLFYNRFDRREFATDTGLTKLGVENAGVFITRGLLLDVASLQGVARLEAGYEITSSDLRGALRQHNLEIRTGDAVLIHTGWGSLWKIDNDRFAGDKPGLGAEGARFLATQEISILGTDAWGPDVMPFRDPEVLFPAHQVLLAHNGIYIVENLDTSALVQDGVYEFAFICTPLPLKGASGSPVNPIAVR